MLCSTLLTKCFTSLLLRTYFKTKTSITVRTLEELVDRPDVSIAGRLGLIEIIQQKPEVFNNLVNRLLVYENKLGIDSTEMTHLARNKVIEDVNEGRAVIITDTFHTNLFTRIYPNLNLIQSDVKYNQRFIFCYVYERDTNFRVKVHRM